MRTPGTIEAHGFDWPCQIMGDMKRLVPLYHQEITRNRVVGYAVNEEQGQHLADCWNAIEAAGGNPAIVGELVAALEAVADLDDPSSQNYDTRVSAARAKVRAVLKRVKGGA